MTQDPMRAKDFINTLGVNTHIPYTDGGYANLTNISADISYLGIDAIRDGISNGQNGSAPLSSYITLAKEGYKFTFLLFSGGNVTTADVNSQLGLVAQVQAAVPGSVLAVEGVNEINNSHITYNSVGGLQCALDLQAQIYSDVHASAALSGVSVDYFTGYAAGDIAVGPDPATTSGLADFDNQHPYPNHGQAPKQWVNPTQALGNENPPTGAAVYTETGYSTSGGTSGGVNQDVQAKYTLDLLMDDAQSGISRTYLYQLMDAYQPGSPQGDDEYGLFDSNNQPKAAATAIHNLTSILSDTGTSATSFATTSLNYTLSNLPSTGSSLALEKSNGTADIVVWNEPQIWNESSGTEVAAPTTSVTMQLGATYKSVEVFDPLTGTTAIQTLTNASSVTLALTDHPLIVEVGSQATTPVAPPVTTPPVTATDTLTLRVSEDAYDGDALFTVKVDGTQVGGTYTASTAHSSGDAGVITLTGNWGATAHDVQVTFLNDAYGGTPTTDRNLYVNSIAYDGVTYSGTSATMQSAGSHDFTVGGTTPAISNPSDTVPVTPPVTTPPATTTDTLTLRVSEDAYDGDALFTVKVDGTQVGNTYTATAAHSSGDTDIFTLTGDWGTTAHDVQLTFLNDAYGGTPTTDRNLYVNSIAYDGVTYSGTSVTMQSAGSHDFTVGGTTPAISTPTDTTPPVTTTDTLTLRVSEDAYDGDALFTVKVDGTQVGGTYTASTAHSSGNAGVVTLTGDWGAAAHNVQVTFLNDAYGGTPTTDRNLYVNSIAYDGVTYSGTSATMLSAGSHDFTVGGTTPAISDPSDLLTR